MAQLDVKIIFQGKEAIANIQLTDRSIEQLAGNLKKYNEETKKLPAAQKPVVQGNAAMSQSLGQLGWVLGDANMFMVNFRMGMMSVANNIPMVVQGFMQAKQQAADLGQSFKQSLVSSIIGPGGVMIAINALMFALQVLPQLFGDSEKAAQETTDKIKELAAAAEGMSRTTLSQKLAIEEIALATLEAQKQREIQGSTRYSQDKEGNVYSIPGEASAATVSAINLTVQAINTLRNALENLGIEQNRQNELAEARQKFLKATTAAENEYWKNEIERLQSRDKAIKADKSLAGIKVGDYSRVYLLSGDAAASDIEKINAAGGSRMGSYDSSGVSNTLSRAAQNAKISALINSVLGTGFVKVTEQPKVINESTLALENQLIVANELNDTLSNVAKTGINSFSQMFTVFKNANSVGQVLVNTLAQMAAKIAAMVAINSALKMLEISLPDLTFFAQGGIVTKPTFGVVGEAGPEAVIPLSKINNTVMPQNITVNVVGRTILRKGDIYVSYQNENKLRNKKY